MSSQEETNPWVQRPFGTKPTDPMAELDEEDIFEMQANLKGLEMVITEAQREAEALRQRIRDFKASHHRGAHLLSSYYGGVLPEGRALPEPPVPEPGSASARYLAESRVRIDRIHRARGLRYLKKALTIKRLLNRET